MTENEFSGPLAGEANPSARSSQMEQPAIGPETLKAIP